jgi:small subunit ribosomal protein S4
MARYTGPRVKKMRGLGVNLPGLSRKSIDKRPFPPGQHGQNRKRKVSDYGKQLHEKQKLRLNYGMGEQQLRRLVMEARRSQDATGAKLIELLERRLDNVVFRAGYAATIPAARQLVAHGHILVNGRRVNIPSYRVTVGDVIRPKDQTLHNAHVQECVASPALARPEWLEFEASRMVSRVTALPTADSVPFPLEVQLVVEYYSKRL